MVHCKFCGNTNLKTIQVKIFKDPIFVLIHTLLALLAVYLYFKVNSESLGVSLAMFGIIFYVFALIIFLMYWDRSPEYFCKDCGTLTRIVTDVNIAEYEAMPERKKIVQRQEPKQRHLKEVVTITGSVGSVVSLIIVLVSK